MGIYNFEKRFVPLILSGAKTHTIRATRRYPDWPGRWLFLYTGLRHKSARRLMWAVCTRVQKITIGADNRVHIDGERLSADECEALAQSDGFANFDDMMRFWDGRRPFAGDVIHWEKRTHRLRRPKARTEP